MDLVKAYKYFSEERIKLIKDLAEKEQLIGKQEQRLKKLKKENYSESEIKIVEEIIEIAKTSANEYREVLDLFFEAAESIKAIIALKNHVKTKGYDLYWELENVLSPVLKEYIYGKE